MKDKEIENMLLRDKMIQAKIFLENLEMNMAYEHQETIHLLMDLVEKATPKTVEEFDYFVPWDEPDHYNGTCPECGCNQVYEDSEYCPVCHQRLDWSELPVKENK